MFTTNTVNSPLESLKRKIRQFFATFADNVSRSIKCWSKWLTPGLSVKRWLVVSVMGILIICLGLASFLQLTTNIRLITFLAQQFTIINQIFPSHLLGIVVIIVGLWLTFWGQIRAISSITEVLKPEGNQELIDLLLSYRRLNRGPKIVALGGGSGLSSLLRGLKQYSNNLTAIVTVADDGGSSGRLRQELGVLPPGDIRNCITALAQEESLLTELFQYRFSAGDGLKGHSFGNLFLTAMSEITGNLEKAIAASSKVLAVQGQVLPATLNDVHLWAELDQGQHIKGESNIAAAKGKIAKIGCIPANPKALPATIKAIESADVIILGPGSLYTSIIPNLLVPEIREAIAQAKAPRIYVCNIMTQPGETDSYSVSDHIKAIDKVCGQKLFDTVLVNQPLPSSQALDKYAQEGSYPVITDHEKIIAIGRQTIPANILEEDKQTHCIRHNSQKLAKRLFENWSGRTKSVDISQG